MTPLVRLQEHHLADLQTIREIGPEALQKVLAELKKANPIPLRPKDLHAHVRTALGDGQDTATEALLRQMFSLYGLIRQLNLTADEVFAGLKLGLSPAQSKWNEKAFQDWLSVAGIVQQLFDLEIIRLSSKALDLSYEHAELLQRARILTDVRPVFNDDATEIRGAVVSHTLFLRYDDVEGDHSMSLAVDEKDIRSLINQCERALKKAETARTHLERNAKLATIVPGEGDDELN